MMRRIHCLHVYFWLSGTLCLLSICQHQSSAFVFPTPHRANHRHFPIIRESAAKQSSRHWATIEEIPTMDDAADTTTPSTIKKQKRIVSLYQLPRTAYRVYTSYAKRLWTETNVSARTRIANDKVRGAIRGMQQTLLSNEYSHLSDSTSSDARLNLLRACEEMLQVLPPADGDENTHASTEIAIQDGGTSLTHHIGQGDKKSRSSTPTKKKKKHRSILFGALMGAAVACWVFSGNYVFTGLFCLMTIVGQLEYYRMVMNTGVYPARRISVIGASSMFVTALFAPNLHQICLPMFGLWAMIWFLTMRRQFATIPEIATTFTGMFYLGYVPSFWVRTRLLGAKMEPTRLYGLLRPIRDYLKSKFGIYLPGGLIHLPITSGAVFIFWSWLSLAFSDVGAYFIGRKYGKTKLGQIAPAAGATSPNKSVEGVLGGCAVSAGLSILGAWVQKWPYFVLTGALHGTILGLLGLIGDLTASMLKRDAGLKDFGDLIPEHGGIMDRVDSFIWTAPYSWLVCAYIIPALRASIAQ